MTRPYKLQHRSTLSRLRFLADKFRSKGKVSRPQFTALYECSARTFYRDVECLRDRFGYVIEYDAGNFNWRLISAPKATL